MIDLLIAGFVGYVFGVFMTVLIISLMCGRAEDEKRL